MSTITVLDSTGTTQTVQAPLVPGQALMAASRPVVIASDQSAIPVTGTFFQATQPVSISGSVPVTGTFWQATQPVSNAGTFAVQAAQSGTWNIGSITTLPALATGANVIGGVTQSGTWTVAVSNASMAITAAALPLPSGAATSANQSTLNTAIGSTTDTAAANGAAGSALAYLRAIKDAATDATTPSPVKIDQTTDGTTNRVNAVPGSTAYALIPAPSTYRVATSAATTNAANIKSGAGCVKGIQGVNHAAASVYIHLYDMTSSPTVGTSTIRKTQEVPASAAFAFDYSTGLGFATGISISMTKGSNLDTDTTALASGDITSLNVDYH
jgi:hypothetical protein